MAGGTTALLWLGPAATVTARARLASRLTQPACWPCPIASAQRGASFTHVTTICHNLLNAQEFPCLNIGKWLVYLNYEYYSEMFTAIIRGNLVRDQHKRRLRAQEKPLIPVPMAQLLLAGTGRGIYNPLRKDPFDGDGRLPVS